MTTQLNVLVLVVIFCITQITATDKIEGNNGNVQLQNYQQQYDSTYNVHNYASSFPYKSPISSSSGTNQQFNYEEDSQRQIPLNYGAYDKFEKPTQGPIIYDDQESIRPKPVIKYSEEQLNLPNPHLINSNIPKDGKPIPCPDYYPCRSYEPETLKPTTDYKQESSPVFGEPTLNYNRDDVFHSQVPLVKVNPLESINHQGPSINYHKSFSSTQIGYSQDSNEPKNFASRDVTVTCYGLECSSQVKTSDNYDSVLKKFQEVTSKNVDVPRPIRDPSTEFLENLQSQILYKIFEDLRKLQQLPISSIDTEPVNKIGLDSLDEVKSGSIASKNYV